jgi:hypothetical protein
MCHMHGRKAIFQRKNQHSHFTKELFLTINFSASGLKTPCFVTSDMHVLLTSWKFLSDFFNYVRTCMFKLTSNPLCRSWMGALLHRADPVLGVLRGSRGVHSARWPDNEGTYESKMRPASCRTGNILDGALTVKVHNTTHMIF